MFSIELFSILVVQHGTINKKHHCPLCPLKFTSKNKLSVHMNSHTKLKRNYELNMILQIVSKCFFFSIILAHQCEYCSQRYRYSGDLNKHLRLHLGENIYKCPDCPKDFRLPQELRQHSYEHYKEQKAKNIEK